MEAIRIEAENNRLDDLVSQWHEGSSGVTLREYLGMTPEDFDHWLKDPEEYCETAFSAPAP